MDQNHVETSAPVTIRVIVFDLVQKKELASHLNRAAQEIYRTTNGRCPHIDSVYVYGQDIFMISEHPLTKRHTAWLKAHWGDGYKRTEFGDEYNVPNEIPTGDP